VPASSYFVASDEPEALQTVQEVAAGRDVTPEPGFREVRRPHRMRRWLPASTPPYRAMLVWLPRVVGDWLT
jgi:hypothetical protein